jgi:hypothetical protein
LSSAGRREQSRVSEGQMFVLKRRNLGDMATKSELFSWINSIPIPNGLHGSSEGHKNTTPFDIPHN